MNKNILTIAFFVCLIASKPALACQCFVYNSPQEAAEVDFKRCHTVFRGKLLSLSRKSADEIADAFAVFQVNKFLKGGGNASVTIETRFSPEACGLGSIFERSIGEEFLVFVSKRGGNRKHASRCGATQIVKDVSQEVWDTLGKLEKSAGITRGPT